MQSQCSTWGSAMQSRSGVRDLSFVLTLTWFVAPLLALCSLAGLLYGQRGLYDRDALTLPAQIGQDAVMLIVGVPLLIVSTLLACRGSTRALLSWVGALLFIAYFNYFRRALGVAPRGARLRISKCPAHPVGGNLPYFGRVNRHRQSMGLRSR